MKYQESWGMGDIANMGDVVVEYGTNIQKDWSTCQKQEAYLHFVK